MKRLIRHPLGPDLTDRRRVQADRHRVALALVAATPLYAQRGAGRGGPPPAAREAAALDLTGNWVSVVVEDWKWRMVTPKKGVYDSLPLNAEARKVADSWDPAKDEAAGEQCRAYGAANIMRLPGRLRISWEDANTLRVDTDAGTQSRLLRFREPRLHHRASRAGRDIPLRSGSTRRADAAPRGPVT